MRPYIVHMINSNGPGSWSETKADLIVSSERAARGVVRHFRDRVEQIVAEPVEVMTSKQAIDNILDRLGYLPSINPDFREQRLGDLGRNAFPNVIR